ncbi:MAG: glycosyltransferase family 4 protein [Desulfococcaceae bacterium]
MLKKHKNHHILHVVPMMGPGGMELAMSRVIRGLDLQKGFRHSVICLAGDAVIRNWFDDTVQIYCMNARSNELRLPLRLARLIRKLSPAVIHARNWSAWPDVAMARMMLCHRPSLIFSFHGLDSAGLMPFRRRIASQLLAHVTSRIFTVSASSAKLMSSHMGIAEKRIDIIPNGVDTGLFSPRKHSESDKKHILRIGTVGSLSPVKNQALLIRACAELIESGIRTEIHLAGEGRERERLENLIRSLGISDHVFLHGHVADIPAFLQKLDIFIMPSDSEAHPNALIEAMSAGLPCIATAVGGVPEVLDYGKYGCLVTACDISQMRESLRELIANPDRRESLGKAARQRVIEKYSLEQMIQAYEFLYRNAGNDSDRGSSFQNANKRFSAQNSILSSSCKGSCKNRPKPDNPLSSLSTVIMLSPLPPLTGGMATVADNLSKSSLAEQYRMIMINSGKTTPEKRSVWKGIRAQISLIYEIISAIIRHHVQIVHIHTCSGFTFWRDCIHMLISKILGCAFVCHIHGGMFGLFVMYMNPVGRYIAKYFFENSAALIVLGRECQEKMIFYAPEANWQVVPNGVPVPVLRNAAKEKEPNFLFLGNLHQGKGVYDLIRAVNISCAHGFQGTVHIAGGADSPIEKEKIEEMIRSYGLENRIKLPGIISGKQKEAYLEMADAFILPSYAEGLPMAMLEAMAYELPLIVTNIGAIPEVISEGKEGYLIRPGDTAALADRIMCLYRDCELRQRMGKKGRERVLREYSMDCMSEKISDIYSGILKNRENKS